MNRSTLAPTLYLAWEVAMNYLTPMSPVNAANSDLQPQQAQCGGTRSRCEALEVLSLGVTFDKFRQGKLWEALKTGTAFSPLRDPNGEKVPWSVQDKVGLTGKRAIDGLENAVATTPMYWGVPSMYASIPYWEERTKDPREPILGLTGSADSNGLAWHLFVASDWLFSESPDKLFELAFQFFDKHTDVPLLFVSAVDSSDDRDMAAPPGTPRMLRNGRYFVDFPDSIVVFALGRRERVERLRKFAWEDKHNSLGQNKIRMAYYDLRRKLANAESYNTRDVSVDEWLVESAKLAMRDDVRLTWGTATQRSEWIPTPWFPVPWSKEQISVFDRLPTLGYVHRPVFVEWKDTDGKTINEQEKRSRILKMGVESAVKALGSTSAPSFPTRLVIANGGNTDRSMILHGALTALKETGAPEYEITSKTKFIDTDRRLGNTGAASFFMQAAIGIMGSYREGGVSAAINMRDPNGASIMLISPPPDELRSKQRHPAGGDVFRHKVEPAYDSEVYKQ